MSKKECDFTKRELIDWMIENNPDIVFKEKISSYVCLLSYKPINELNFPDGWYLTKDHTLTNRGNSSSNMCSCIDIHVTRM